MAQPQSWDTASWRPALGCDGSADPKHCCLPGDCQVSGQRAEDSAEVIDSHVLGDRMSQDVVTIFS